MTRHAAAKLRENFSEVINQVVYGKDRVVLTRHGKDMAAVVPIEDLRLLEKLEDEIDRREAKKALEDVKRRGSLPWDQVKKKLDKKKGRKGA